MSSKRNLYWRTAGNAKSRENHRTEFFAAAMRASERLRGLYSDLVLAAHARKLGWETPRITADVDTQVGVDSGTPDMILCLADGRVIAVEHKLDAAQTVSVALAPRSPTPEPALAEAGSAGLPAADTERERQLQLWRYAQRPEFDALVYVRRSIASVEDRVWLNEKYVRPAGGYMHFLWRDFYPLLAQASTDNILVDWLREGFELEGDVPVPAFFGEVDANNPKSFDYWSITKTSAKHRGWSVTDDHHIGLTMSKNSASLAKQIAVMPRVLGDDRFRIRVVPAQAEDIDSVTSRLRMALTRFGIESIPEMTQLKQVDETTRQRTSVAALDVFTSLTALFGNLHEGVDIEQRLDELVMAVSDALKRMN